MKTYVKLPLEVQAIQWFKIGDHPEVKLSVNPGFEDEAFFCTPNGNMKVTPGDLIITRVAFVCTPEGNMKVTPGDWIITGVKGEHYPCKDEIFKESYKEVPTR